MKNVYYVYGHTRLSDGKCFYIGKGKDGRAYTTRSRNKYWNNIVKKDGGFNVIIYVNGIAEQRAYELEKEFIAKIGRDNLCNMTDGGDAPPNPTGVKRTAEYCKKMSELNKGKNNPMYGKIPSEESNKKRSESMKGK